VEGFLSRRKENYLQVGLSMANKKVAVSFAGPQSVKKDIPFLGQFLIQKKGLKFLKDILFSAIGQIFYDIPTWLKRHITTKYQVSKVPFARNLSSFSLHSFQ
jgi:hypothetical protein